MFALGPRASTTILFVSLISALVFADSGSHDHLGRRHHGHAQRGLEKRSDNARFTFYDAGVNACGSFDQPNDFIVALNSHQWDGGSHCYKTITLNYKGKTAQAKITDYCVECPYAAIDLSRGLMEHMVGSNYEDIGQVYGEWDFGSGAAPPPPPPPTTTTHKPKTTTTTTHKPSTTTTSHKESTTSTTHSTSSHHTTSTTSTSTTSATTSSTSTSTAPTSTVTSFDTGMLNQFNLALAQLSDLVLAGSGDA